MDGDGVGVDAYYRVYDKLIDIEGDVLHQDGDLMNDLAKLFVAAKRMDGTTNDEILARLGE